MDNPMQTPNSDVTTQNKEVAAKSDLKTLPEFYKFYYDLLFNKLSKEMKEAITRDSNKALQIIRGNEVDYPHVRIFVKSVCERAEEEWEKHLAKQIPKS